MGSYCRGRRCAPTSLRCSRHKGGCDAARKRRSRAAASWLLAGPSPGGAGLPLVPLRSSPRHKSPTPDTAHRAPPLVVCIEEHLGGAGKAVVGCASAATLCGAEERRAGRVARRLEATRRPYIVRAPGAAALRSSVPPARGRVCVAALAARAPQGSRPAGPTAVHERRRAPGRGFASLARRALGPSLHLARTLHVVARPTWTTSSS